SLPKGEDPDSFINKFGKEQFEEEISRAQNFFEYQTSQYEKQGAFEDAASTTKAIREIVRILSLLNDELKRNLYIKAIAKKFGLREKLIESELNKFLSEQKSGTQVFTQAKSNPDSQIEKLKLQNKFQNENPFEKELVRLLFSGNEQIVTHILDNVAIDNFTNDDYKIVATIVENGFNEGKISPAYLIEKIEDDDLKNLVLELSLSEYSISKNWDELSSNGKIEKDTYEHAIETVKNYQIFQIEEEIKRNNKLIEESKDELLHLELLKRNKELTEDKKAIIGLKSKNEFGWGND
ncbi:MAG: hypothetical protein HZA74_05135, partial [Ignavibacteriales bacterium]|nr:hypothetical protein [Ignavibacteriales bacterium]